MENGCAMGPREKCEDWQLRAGDYRSLISDPDFDSKFLRESGLIPNLLDLIGDARSATLLDAGTGTGWLFEHVKPRSAHACDIVAPPPLPGNVQFRQENVASLSYPSETFDIIVASLLLIYCADLEGVCGEFRRIAKPKSGKLVVALMQPYFYRTGHVVNEGQFLITRDLSTPMSFPLNIAERVGPFRYYYRPLPDYLNVLIKSGWVIAQIRDWFIDMHAYSNVRTNTKIQRTGSIPLFTFIECRAGNQ